MNDHAVPHGLRLTDLQLVGANRRIQFSPRFSVVKGSITTGKTTLVRLQVRLVTVPARPWQVERHFHHAAAAPGLVAAGVQAPVGRDPIEPRPQRGTLLEAGQADPRGMKDLL